jgi:capsular polysaccharide biosynthesis protein
VTFLRQWWWLLILGPVVAAGAAVGLTGTTPDVYKAEAKVLVGSGEGLEASERLTNTYADMVTLRPVLAEVKSRLNLELSEEELKRKLSVSSDFNSQLVSISAKDESPLRSAQIANITADVFVTTTNRQLLQLTQQPGEPVAGGPIPPPPPAKALVVENAQPSAKSAKPSLLINGGLAAALGLLIAGSMGVAFDALSGSLRPEEA